MKWPVLFLACAVACRSERITTEPATVSADADAWSGSRLVLRSTAFSGHDTLPAVLVGAESLAVLSFGADSISVQLPDTNGGVTLSVRLPSGAVLPTVTVSVHGFSGVEPGPRVEGYPYPWPQGGAPTALGFQDGRLVLLDYRYNTALSLTADTNLWSCLMGPRPSTAGSGLVTVSRRVSDAACSAVVGVPVPPAVAAPDTGDMMGSTQMLAVHLGPGMWVYGGQNAFLERRTVFPPDVVTETLCGETIGLEVSARRDRVVPICGLGTGNGFPVVNAATATVAYRLPNVSRLGTATFSPGGDTLYALASDSLAHERLLSVDATTGVLLASVPLPLEYYEVSANALRADPVGPWLYLLRFSRQDSIPGLRGNFIPEPYLEVRDRASLGLVATIRVPYSDEISLPTYAWGWQVAHWTLLVDPIARRLIASMDNEPNYPPAPARATTLVTFDLMPSKN